MPDQEETLVLGEGQDSEPTFDIPDNTRSCLVLCLTEDGGFKLDQPIIPKGISKFENTLLSQKLCELAVAVLQDKISDATQLGAAGRITKVAATTLGIAKFLDELVRQLQTMPRETQCQTPQPGEPQK